MPTPKQHIEELYTEISKPSRNTKTSAQATNKIAKQALTGTVYITELLQNADDAKLKDAQGKNTKIAARSASFIVEGEYLIFQHDGRHFSPEDVEGICDIANPDREKVIDPDVIGNKGLGFKSLFNIADEVGIVSSEYTFCFNKNHEAWASNPQSVPWQIIPIWKEKSEFPAHVLRHLENDRVSFIIKLKTAHQADVTEALRQLFNTDGRVLLFLRSVKELHIRIDDQLRVITKSTHDAQDEFHQVSISVDTAAKKSWLIYTYQQQVTPDVKKLLKNDPDIPPKYTNQHSGYVDVQLAAPIGAQVTVHQNVSNIFCFLPTSIQSGLPFIVNSEFFLDLARKGFDEQPAATAWNHMILSDIYAQQFKLLQFLAKMGHWKTVLRYIAFPSDNKFPMTDAMKKVIKERFDKEKFNYKFVADQNEEPQKIATLRNDTAQMMTSIDFEEQYRNITHDSLEASENLTRLDVNVYTYNDIILFLKEHKFRLHLQNPDSNLKLMEWLISLIDQIEDTKTHDKFIKDLKETAFVVSTNETLVAPKDVYLPSSKFDYLISEDDIVNIIHSELKDAHLVNFFKDKLGIKALTTGEIINHLNKKGNEKLSVRIIKKIFEQYLAKQEPNSTEFAKKWNGLKLKTKSGYDESTRCYLPDALTPEFPLKFAYGLQIDADTYIDFEKNKPHWKAFFLAIGVQQTLLPTNIKSIVEAANENTSEPRHIAFITRLKSIFFQDDQAAPLLEDCKSLKLLTLAGEYASANSVYLSDTYHPLMPLQTHVEKLRFLSVDYIAQGEALDWKKFFLYLGAQEKISFTSRAIHNVAAGVVSNSLTDAYVDWLAEKYNVHQGGTGGWKSQHTISCVYEIKLFSTIKSTPIFWSILWREWGTLSDALTEPVSYTTRFGSFNVPSSVIFLIDKAAQAQYKRNLCELYSPKIREALNAGYDLPYFYDPAHTLLDEQIDALHLKKQLSFADAIKILTILSTKPPKDHETQAHIKFVYQQLILMEDDEDVTAAQLAELKLLNDKNEFVDASQLYALDTQAIKLKPNAQLLKKFSDINMSNFKVLSQKLKIKRMEMDIEPSILEVNQKQSDEIRNKLALLCLLECKAQDVTEDKFFEFQTQYVADFLRKPLRFINCSSITITGSLHETTKIWVNKPEAAIYYVGECDVAFLTDYYAQIARIYHWKISVADFIKVILRDKASICEEFNLTVSKIQEINQTIQQLANPIVASAVVQDVQVPHVADNQDSKQITHISTGAHSQMLPQTATVRLGNTGTGVTGSVSQPLCNDDKMDVVVEDRLIPTVTPEVLSLTQPQPQPQMQVMQTVHFASSVSQAQPPTSLKRTHSGSLLNTQANQSGASSSAFQSQPLSVIPMAVQRQSDMDETGRKGEEFLFAFLKQRYKSQHSDCQFVETRTGFILQKESYKKEITWMNALGEAGKPYDYTIVTTTPQGVKTRLVDVKASKSHKTDEFKLNYSMDEWSAIQQQASSATVSPFYFYYVGHLSSDTPFVKKANISSQLEHLEVNNKLTVKDLTTEIHEEASTHVKDIKQIKIKLN